MSTDYQLEFCVYVISVCKCVYRVHRFERNNRSTWLPVFVSLADPRKTAVTYGCNEGNSISFWCMMTTFSNLAHAWCSLVAQQAVAAMQCDYYLEHGNIYAYPRNKQVCINLICSIFLVHAQTCTHSYTHTWAAHAQAFYSTMPMGTTVSGHVTAPTIEHLLSKLHSLVYNDRSGCMHFTGSHYF